MVDEARFQRLEDKVDKVKEDIHEVKEQLTAQILDMRNHIEKVEEHIAGDNKIIKELEPVLAKLPHIVQMAEDYHEDKIVKKRVKKIQATFMKTCAGIGMVLGIMVSN